MILKTADDRVILWGAKVEEGYITAELVFFAAAIGTPQVVVTNRNGSERHLIKLPDGALRSNFEGKATMVSFEKVKS